jgi:adenylate cyclase
LVLRGKTEALRAFEPLHAEQYDDPATKSYLDAFAKLEAADPLASFHLKRLLNGATGTRITMD